MDTRIVTLFLLTYEDGEKMKQHPLYATTDELATKAGLDWLMEHEEYTYRSIQQAPKEGSSIDETFYSAKKVEVLVDGLQLYVHDFFIGHTLHRRAIYAPNEQEAIVNMNQYYAVTGLGNNHRTIGKSIDGILLDGIYYPAGKEE